MSHIIDKVCSCEFCTMLDCLFGDPLLSAWEKKFVENMIEYGWMANYTEKQKAKIKEVFNKMRKKSR